MYLDDKGKLKVRSYSLNVVYDKKVRDRFPSTVKDDLTLTRAGVAMNNIWQALQRIEQIKYNLSHYHKPIVSKPKKIRRAKSRLERERRSKMDRTEIFVMWFGVMLYLGIIAVCVIKILDILSI